MYLLDANSNIKRTFQLKLMAALTQTCAYYKYTSIIEAGKTQKDRKLFCRQRKVYLHNATQRENFDLFLPTK